MSCYYSSLVYIIETVFAFGLFVNAALFIPQILELYRVKSSKSLSITTFLGFNIIQIFTILHAYIHGDNILLLGNLLSLITCGTVTVLIIVYRSRSYFR